MLNGKQSVCLFQDGGMRFDKNCYQRRSRYGRDNATNARKRGTRCFEGDKYLRNSQ